MSESFIKLDIETYNRLFNARVVYEEREKKILERLAEMEKELESWMEKTPFIAISYDYANKMSRLYGADIDSALVLANQDLKKKIEYLEKRSDEFEDNNNELKKQIVHLKKQKDDAIILLGKK